MKDWKLLDISCSVHAAVFIDSSLGELLIDSWSCMFSPPKAINSCTFGVAVAQENQMFHSRYQKGSHALRHCNPQLIWSRFSGGICCFQIIVIVAKMEMEKVQAKLKGFGTE